MAKKALSTIVDEELLRQFKVACAMNDKKMNVVLEELLKAYIEQTKNKKPE